MTRDEEYMKKRIKEKMAHNIIKWWNVKDLGTKNFIGSLDLEDPMYGCPIYQSSNDSMSQLLLKMDHIDEIDYRDPISPPAEELRSYSEKDEEAVRIANDIFMRLQKEAEDDMQKRVEEIENAKRAYENQSSEDALNDSNYNAATGSYSGLYGQVPMNEEEQDAFQAIMSKNNDVSQNASALFQ